MNDYEIVNLKHLLDKYKEHREYVFLYTRKQDDIANLRLIDDMIVDVEKYCNHIIKVNEVTKTDKIVIGCHTVAFTGDKEYLHVEWDNGASEIEWDYLINAMKELKVNHDRT